ncbi:MAG TPA: rRNA maturation RNase YbeY [Chitinophagaceae bacterium]|nr:rRNA maturation RNase YbeY [Chitinophagaceae bacterium]
MATITFHELTPVSWFRDRRLTKALLIELFKKERIPLAEVSYILCDDEYLLQINRQFLKHDDYTDIITFDLSGEIGDPQPRGPASATTPKVGEIYISIERVADNARQLKTEREEELRRVMIHGCLHLCGYKDKLNEEKAVMRKKEDQYLRLFKQRST